MYSIHRPSSNAINQVGAVIHSGVTKVPSTKAMVGRRKGMDDQGDIKLL